MSTPVPERLAIEGGVPAFPLGPPAWPPADPAVESALLRTYRAGHWGRYQGPACEELRSRLAALYQNALVRLCCSGTAAVELGLRGLQVGPGDEVLLAAYDFGGNFRAIEAVGATPVLADVIRNGWVFDCDRLRELPAGRIKAVVASHLHGMLADMPRLMELARERGWVVVEDACQVAGATVAGRPPGCWGDVGTLSFGGSKLLTAGRGGALLTHDPVVAQRVKLYCEQGNDAFPLSEMQAAVLLPQLDRLAERHARRTESVKLLRQLLRDVPGLTDPATADVEGLPAYYKLGWFYDPPEGRIDRPTFLAAVQAEGIALDAGFATFARRSERRCRRADDLSNSERAAAATMILSHPLLLEADHVLAKAAAAIRKVAVRYFG